MTEKRHSNRIGYHHPAIQLPMSWKNAAGRRPNSPNGSAILRNTSTSCFGQGVDQQRYSLASERVLGSTARFWLHREAGYREGLARRVA